MGNRTRFNQTQSARMYFQDHDHRDVILGDNYHGAIYVPDRFEPAWRKYKPRLLFAGVQDDDDYFQTCLFSYDPQDEFVSLLKFSNGESELPAEFDGNTLILSNGMIASYGFNLASKNGYDYKRLELPQGFYGGYRYGENELIQVLENGLNRTLRWSKYLYQEGEETASGENWSTTRTFDRESDKIDAYRGRHSNGCFFSYSKITETSDSITTVYYITSNSNRRSSIDVLHSETHTRPKTGAYSEYYFGSRIWKCGTHYLLYRNQEYNIGISTSYTHSLLISSDANLSSWTEYNFSSSSWTFSLQAVLWRNNTAWLYYRSRYNNKNRWRLYKTTDFATFTEVTIPDYLDIPYCDDGDISIGRHGAVVNPDKAGIRLILNENGTIPALPENYIQFTFFFDSKYTQFATEYVESDNGVLTSDEITGTDMIFGSTDAAWSNLSDTIVYIDNLRFQSSANNVCYKVNYEWDGANPIAAGDYVFGSGS